MFSMPAQRPSSGPRSSACANWKACAFPISVRGGAMASCGSAGVLRPSRKVSDHPSPAPPMFCWRWTMIWKRSEPTPMNCRWWPQHWPTTTPNCAGRHTASSINGATPMAGNLLIALPDAFGTKSFLRDAPEWVADWTGFRPGQRAADRGRRGNHQMVEAEGPRSQGEAAGVFRRHGRRIDRRDLPAFCRPRPDQLRLGHQPDQ